MSEVTVVSVRDFIMADSLQVILGWPYDDGDAALAMLYVLPISDGFDEAVRDGQAEARAALGIKASFNSKEEIEAAFAAQPNAMIKLTRIVSRLKILHSVVTKDGRQFFETVEQVKQLPAKVQDKILAVITEQEKRSGRLPE